MLAPVLAGAGAAAAVAASAVYHIMAPTGQWLGRTFARGTRGAKQLALTYDDGPNDPYTLRLLDVLAKHNVHATFFLIGAFARQRPEIARAVAGAGHIIGNHTFTHPLLTFKSENEIRRELIDCRAVLHDTIGHDATSILFRPPFGGRRPAVLRIARELGFTPVMWSITSYDWEAPPAAVIERNVSRSINGGDVILLHDGGHLAIGADRSQTVLATDHLIGRFQSEGYVFCTIPEMIETANRSQKERS
jgi:peptidoglycan-N-acetylglucosamine deacetylase